MIDCCQLQSLILDMTVCGSWQRTFMSSLQLGLLENLLKWREESSPRITVLWQDKLQRMRCFLLTRYHPKISPISERWLWWHLLVTLAAIGTLRHALLFVQSPGLANKYKRVLLLLYSWFEVHDLEWDSCCDCIVIFSILVRNDLVFFCQVDAWCPENPLVTMDLNDQLKPGGSIPEKGKKITLHVTKVEDLDRDVIKVCLYDVIKM